MKNKPLPKSDSKLQEAIGLIRYLLDPRASVPFNRRVKLVEKWLETNG